MLSSLSILLPCILSPQGWPLLYIQVFFLLLHKQAAGVFPFFSFIFSCIFVSLGHAISTSCISFYSLYSMVTSGFLAVDSFLIWYSKSYVIVTISFSIVDPLFHLTLYHGWFSSIRSSSLHHAVISTFSTLSCLLRYSRALKHLYPDTKCIKPFAFWPPNLYI